MVHSVIHVLDSIADEASGPSYSVPSLCTALSRRGSSVKLFTLGQGRGLTDAAFEHQVFPHDFANVPILKLARISQSLEKGLLAEMQVADLVHTHGLWLMSNVYPSRASRAQGKPLVLSPRGMLGKPALQFSSGRKALFWKLFQKTAADQVSCFHATSEQEVRDIRDFGLRNPVALIPNGVDLPKGSSGGRKQKVVLSLGRIHPKKGLLDLLRAWLLVEGLFPEWELKIIGPDENGYASVLRAFVRKERLQRVHLLEPVFGLEKMRAYEEAGVFVLPTLNENFGMVVAEALSSGTPVICTKGAPWSGLVEQGAGWWVDNSVEAIASAIRDALQRPEHALASMGQQGREWMRRDYSWDAVGQQMTELYEWLIEGSTRPVFVDR
jgi:glycosyltransferase involved in cell wall biosynthesis